MFKLLSLSLAMIVFGSTSSAWADDAKKTDKDKLQGTWQVTKGISNGKELPKEMAAKVKVVFSDEKMTLYPPDGNGTQTLEHTFTIDESKSPKTIDATRLKDGEAQKDQQGNGIYKLNGDTLTLCLAARLNKERPTKFEATEDSGAVLLTLKRVKK